MSRRLQIEERRAGRTAETVVVGSRENADDFNLWRVICREGSTLRIELPPFSRRRIRGDDRRWGWDPIYWGDGDDE